MSRHSKITLSDLDLSNHRRVLLRLDLNVPVENGAITDSNRIVQSLPTVNRLLDSGLRVIVLSHFSRIKDIGETKSGKKSLRLVAEELGRLLPSRRVTFVPHRDFGEIRSALDSDGETDVFVLENTRYYDVDESNSPQKWESKNSPELAKFWASLGDLYINDAFGTSHRAHASNVGLAALLPSAVGLLVEKELEFLSRAVESKESPKVLILGGSKVSDKLKLINEIAPKVDRVLIGGGMSYTFLKAMGKEVGSSIVESEMVEECRSMLSRYGDKLVLPVDHVVAPEFKDVPGTFRGADEAQWSGEMALDIGPKTIELYRGILDSARVVIWNGPMGVFEFSSFQEGTRSVALKLADITERGAYTVIGGGDSAAAAEKFGLSSRMSFISTGGGASLSFFEGSAMPGIDSIPDKK